MLLAIDIGNTAISLGGFEEKTLAFVARISTDIAKTSDEYAARLLQVLSLYGVKREEIDGAILSSVVPPLTDVMKRAVRFLYQTEALVVGPGIKTGLGIHCDNPSSVGADIIAACVAAYARYGSSALIVDMGTATNMMVVNGRGTFVGVSIMPGVRMGLDSLADETAQLPHVSLEAPRSVIGKNTADCMKSGVIFGNACMIDGMIDRIRAEMRETLPVIATGEFAPLILPHLAHEVILDEHLVLEGLRLIYHKNH